MTRIKTIRAEYVDAIPATIADGTAVHKCCCGCGQEVVTPLGPIDWSVTVDGGAVSVYPSIGNWSFPCKSHYWINCGQIRWAEQWSEAQISYGRQRDRIAKQRQYGEGEAGLGFWARLWRFITGR